MNFYIASPWKNKEEVDYLSSQLKTRGHQAYSFLDSGANLLSGKPIEEEMKIFSEALINWKSDTRISQIFESEMKAVKESDAVILLLPAGHSAHLEAGVAYGLGKKIIIVGPIDKPEVVYLISDKLYIDTSSFLKDLDAGSI